ncbi:MAG: repressor LexA [Gemmatimonadaceae bacterium]|nr:repressor LexA [Gemmatimonadaceae bacterium]
MPEQLTQLESSVYQYLLDFTAENTYQPSIRDIGRQFKIKSTKTVSDLLQSLAKKGLIERDPARSRGVRLLGFGGGTKTKPVPFYSRVRNDRSALAVENRESYITVDRQFAPSENVFFLRMQGDSMVGRAICDGDFILINPDISAHDGDVIAARIGADQTVMTLRQHDNSTILEPANRNESPRVILPTDDFMVLGVVCGVFRPQITMASVHGMPLA